MLERLEKYEILETIAAGGQGTVYRARDTVLDRVVAVKIINQPVAHFDIVTVHSFSHC